MLINVGILIVAYMGVKFFDKYHKPDKHERTPIQSTQQLEKVNDSAINEAEKKGNHYLKATTVAIGVSSIRNVYPPLSLPLHFLSVGLITYIVIPALKRAEKSLRKRKIGNDLLVSTSAFLCIATNQLFTISMGYWFYHLGSKLIAKTQKQSKEMLTNIFDQQPRNVWLLKDNIEIEVPVEKLQINDVVIHRRSSSN